MCVGKLESESPSLLCSLILQSSQKGQTHSLSLFPSASFSSSHQLSPVFLLPFSWPFLVSLSFALCVSLSLSVSLSLPGSSRSLILSRILSLALSFSISLSVYLSFVHTHTHTQSLSLSHPSRYFGLQPHVHALAPGLA